MEREISIMEEDFLEIAEEGSYRYLKHGLPHIMSLIETDSGIGEIALTQIDLKIHRCYIDSSDKTNKLYYTLIAPHNSSPSTNIIANIGIVPCIYGESSEFLEFGVTLALNGLAVHIIDVRGMGLSTGNQIYTPLRLQADIGILIAQMAKTQRPSLLYAHGHSCSLISTLLLNNPQLLIASVIYESPIFLLRSQKSYTQYFMLLIHRIMTKVFMSTNIDPQLLTSDEIILRKLIQTHLRARHERRYMISFKMDKYLCNLLPNAGRFNLPVLILQGDMDQISNLQFTKQFHHQCKSENRKLKIFRGGGHSLHLDQLRKELSLEVVEWVRHLLTPHINTLNTALNLVVKNPPAVRFWGKRILFYSSIIVYLIIGNMFRKRTKISTWYINLIVWPYFLLKYIFFDNIRRNVILKQNIVTNQIIIAYFIFVEFGYILSLYTKYKFMCKTVIYKFKVLNKQIVVQRDGNSIRIPKTISTRSNQQSPLTQFPSNGNRRQPKRYKSFHIPGPGLPISVYAKETDQTEEPSYSGPGGESVQHNEDIEHIADVQKSKETGLIREQHRQPTKRESVQPDEQSAATILAQQPNLCVAKSSEPDSPGEGAAYNSIWERCGFHPWIPTLSGELDAQPDSSGLPRGDRRRAIRGRVLYIQIQSDERIHEDPDFRPTDLLRTGPPAPRSENACGERTRRDPDGEVAERPP